MPGPEISTEQIIRLLEMTQSLKSAMNGEESDMGRDNAEYEKMMKAIETVRTIQTLAQQYRRQEEDQPDKASISTVGGRLANDSVGSLEARLDTPELLTIKSAIPYLEPGHRRNVSIVVKVIEIQRLMDYYRETVQGLWGKVSGGDDESWRMRMLEYIRPCLEPPNSLYADMLIKFLEMNEITKKIKEALER